MYDVKLAPCADYAPEHCREALEAVCGDLDWVRPGMKIGVKTNLIAGMKPETAAVTHPALLRALTDLLRERGAEVVIGDSPGGLYNAAYVGRVYVGAGLREADLPLNRDFSVREVSLPEAKVARTATVTGWLLDCDEIINFCKLKSHGMMALSAAAKNLFGTIPGTMKPEYHYRFRDYADFADMLVDLDEFWKPRLNLVDAVVAMEGNGPTAGTPKPIGCLLAGTNPHRVDLLCARLIGLDPGEIPTLQAAIARGLTPARVEDLRIDGPWEDFVQKNFQTVVELQGLQFQSAYGPVVSKLVGKAVASRPKLDPETCVGCGKCADVCPARAITMKNRRPVIDRRKCIRCFCCQEFCPKGAMRAHRPPIARLLLKQK